LKSREAKLSESVYNFQPCFSSIATLKAARSLKPIPPWFLCTNNFSQDNQCKPLLLAPPCPHQNAFIIFSISSNKVFGNQKILITYEGIAWRTDLIMTSLSTLDKHLLLQLLILCHTLSLIKLKVAFLLRPTIDGNPRYFTVPKTARTLKIHVITYWSGCSTFLL